MSDRDFIIQEIRKLFKEQAEPSEPKQEYEDFRLPPMDINKALGVTGQEPKQEPKQELPRYEPEPSFAEGDSINDDYDYEEEYED